MSMDKLIEKIAEKQNPTVAGLDPKLSYIPEHIRSASYEKYGKTLEGAADALLQFNKGVIDGIEKGVRTWFFVLAFTAIGLSTNFRELAPYFKGGKPLILYVCGQSFNLALTLLMAYVMFYLVFPEITAKI